MSYELKITKEDIGKTSYVTLAEADEYVKTYYMTTSPEYKAWFNTENPVYDGDKEASLLQSALTLNRFKYLGGKKVRGQDLAFPRSFKTMPGVYFTQFIFQGADMSLTNGPRGKDDGMKAAKQAQIENSLAQITLGTSSIVTAKRRALSGLSGERVDDISRTYDNHSESVEDGITGLYAAEKVKLILKSWLSQTVYTV